jgi:hypothetical protein
MDNTLPASQRAGMSSGTSLSGASKRVLGSTSSGATLSAPNQETKRTLGRRPVGSAPRGWKAAGPGSNATAEPSRKPVRMHLGDSGGG